MAELHLACPHCGRPNDRHDSTDNPTHRPESGSVSLCWGCGEVAIFEITAIGATILRKPGPPELASIMADATVRRALAIRRSARHPDEAIVRTRAAQTGEGPE